MGIGVVLLLQLDPLHCLCNLHLLPAPRVVRLSMILTDDLTPAKGLSSDARPFRARA